MPAEATDIASWTNLAVVLSAIAGAAVSVFTARRKGKSEDGANIASLRIEGLKSQNVIISGLREQLERTEASLRKSYEANYDLRDQIADLRHQMALLKSQRGGGD